MLIILLFFFLLMYCIFIVNFVYFLLCFAGLVLSVGGFLSFMVTGSVAAIRFGVILGGTLLALSVLSLRAYRRGESLPLSLKGQAG